MTIKSKKQLHNKKNKTLKTLKTRKQKGGNPIKFDFDSDFKKETNISNLEENNQLYLVKKMDTDEENEYKDHDEYIGIIESINTTDNKITLKPFGYREYILARTINRKDGYEPWKKVKYNVDFLFKEIEVYSLKSY